MSAQLHHPFDALTVPLRPGLTVIEASAGTGKTYSITRLVLRLLLQGKDGAGIPLPNILAVTFTEKGTQELVDRVRREIRLARKVFAGEPIPGGSVPKDLATLHGMDDGTGLARLTQAQRELDQLSIFTIHGFCRRVLMESALESRTHFQSTMLEKDTEPLHRAAHDWARRQLLAHRDWAQTVVGSGQNPAEWVTAAVRPVRRKVQKADATGGGWRFAADSGTPPVPMLRSFMQDTLSAFDSERQRRHLLSFDDLLRRMAWVLEQESSDGLLGARIRSLYQAALVDECQDTDPMQYRIFQRAFRGHPLFMIGDPKQSIYGFRGADLQAYLDATRSPENGTYTLDRNWRSTGSMVRAVQALFTAHDGVFGADGAITVPDVRAAEDHALPEALKGDGRAALHWWVAYPPPAVSSGRGRKKLDITVADLQDAAMNATANEIVRLRQRGMAGSDIAVLVLDRFQARAIKQALDTRGVAAVTGSDSDVMKSDEAIDLAAIALAVAEPRNTTAVRAAEATLLWGGNAESIARYQQAGHEAEGAQLIGRLLQAQAQWERAGIGVALHTLLSEQGTYERLMRFPDGERRVTNVRHVLEIYRTAAAEVPLPPSAFRGWISRELAIDTTPERRELRLDRDENAVQILTVHKAKGLQFAVVFCPALHKGPRDADDVLDVVPVIAAEEGTAVVYLDASNPEYQQQLARAQLAQREELVRLAYVALTRSIYRCYVAWGPLEKAADTGLGQVLGGADPRESIRALVQANGADMSLQELPLTWTVERLGAPVESPAPASVALGPSAAMDVQARALSVPPERFRAWYTASFSGLSKGAHAHKPETLQKVEPALAGPMTARMDFPKGPAFGDALHKVMERVDFAQVDVDREGTTALISRVLSDRGFTPPPNDEWTYKSIWELIHDTVTSPIPGVGFRLADMPHDRITHEWKFLTPTRTLSLDVVARVLETHGGAATRAYAPVLRALASENSAGARSLPAFLDGIADLVFEHEGKWWILDWKSNNLGTSLADYSGERLAHAMHHTHYMLQYHLYAVGVHRYLKRRVPGYTPATHFGGAIYVFFRGVQRDVDTGWFVDRMNPALLEALDEAMGRMTPSGVSA